MSFPRDDASYCSLDLPVDANMDTVYSAPPPVRSTVKLPDWEARPVDMNTTTSPENDEFAAKSGE